MGSSKFLLGWPMTYIACILKANSHSKSGGSIWDFLECQCCFWIAGGLCRNLLCDYSPSSYSKTVLTLNRSSDWTSTLWVSFQNTDVSVFNTFWGVLAGSMSQLGMLNLKVCYCLTSKVCFWHVQIISHLMVCVFTKGRTLLPPLKKSTT
jgi:hypothetical protein